MTRIADSTATNQLLANYLGIQKSIATAQQQLTSGKISDDFRGVSDRVDLLMSAKSAVARAESNRDSAVELSSRLALQDLHLSAFAEAAKDLRINITESIANDFGTSIPPDLDSFVRMASSALNATFDGRYIFGGTRTDVPPVTVTGLADLAALPLVSDAFANNNIKQAVRLDEGAAPFEYSHLASDVATTLFTSIRAINALGPFTDDLTAAQRTGLETELQNIITAVESANAVVSSNGILQNEAELALNRNTELRDFMRGIVSDIEDADPAEVITRLNADQATAEASARILSDLTRFSLLNFI